MLKMLLLEWFIISLFMKSLVHVSAENKKRVCKSQACKKSAQNLKSNMNPESDPCDNFYEYACGNYSRNHPLTGGYNQMTPFLELRNNILDKTAGILRKSKTQNESDVIHNAKDLYASCVDIESLDRNGKLMIGAYLAEMNLPLTFSFDSNFMKKFKWYSTAAHFVRLNDSFLFDLSFDKDVDGSSKNIAFIIAERNVPNMFPIDSSDAEGEINWKYASDFSVFVKSVAQYFSPGSDIKSPNSQEQLDRDIKNLYEFSCRRQRIRNSISKKFVYGKSISLLELQKWTSDIVAKTGKKVPIVWSDFLKEIFEDFNKEHGPVKIGIKYKVVITDWSYISDMIVLISNTDPKIIAMAMWLDIIINLKNDTTKELRDIGLKFLQALYPAREPSTNRDRICANTVIQNMGFAIAKMNLNKRKINMVDKVRSESDWVIQAFEEKLPKADWMDESSLNASLTKLRNIKKFIGYPEWILNKNILDTTFTGGVLYESDNFVANMVSYKRKKRLSTLRAIHARGPSLAGFCVPPMVQRAVYHPIHNSITVPMAYIQFPFYDHGIQAMNFGSMGFILSHEMAHSIDLLGKDFDENGNLKLQWSPSTVSNYEKQAKCFVRSYASFSVSKLNTSVNGELTRNENIADNVGLSIALHAYDLYSKSPNSDVNLVLPGFEDYTPKKLITLSFATMHCQHLSTEGLKREMLGTHPPGEFRVLGVFTNSEEFAEIWNCPKGSRMNPKKKKCKIL